MGAVAFLEYRGLYQRVVGFRARAVRYLADSGIRQFLDLGCGLTAGDPVHVIAQVAAGSRVVYVDNDRCKSGYAQTRWTGQAVSGERGNGSAQAGIQSASKRPKLGTSKRMLVGCCKCTS